MGSKLAPGRHLVLAALAAPISSAAVPRDWQCLDLPRVWSDP